MVNNYALQNIETLRFWCQKVLPLVYDDSLSYYEVLCKVVKKINELIENDKEQNEAIIDLNEQIGALAEAQTEQYTELSNRIAGEIARAIGKENDLETGLLNLQGLLDLEVARAEAAEQALSTTVGTKEDKSNKVTSMSASSTDTQYPSAKAVYDGLALKEDKANKVTSMSASSTDTQYPSAKAVWDGLALKEDKANKITSMSASSTDNQYPSAKAVWDALQNIQPSGGSDVVFVGASATYADVIDYIAPGDPAERKVVIYVDSMGINMLATEWDDNAQSVTFSAVVGDVLYTRTLTFNSGWSSLGYKDIQALLDGKLSLSGGTMTGALKIGDSSNAYIKSTNDRDILRASASGGNANVYLGNNQPGSRAEIQTGTRDVTHLRGSMQYDILDSYNTQANSTLAGTESNLTSLKLNGTTYKVLPAVTGSDVGKFLRVDAGGDIVAETVPNANTASF